MISRVLGLIPEVSVPNDPDCHYLSVINYRPIDHYASVKSQKGTGPKRTYHPPVIPAVGSLIGICKLTVPTYSGIDLQNQTHDPRDYSIIHRIEITDSSVYLNDVLIAGAPEYKQRVTGKTKRITPAERARFCRGVVWFLLNDETCLLDKLAEIGYILPTSIAAPANCAEIAGGTPAGETEAAAWREVLLMERSTKDILDEVFEKFRHMDSPLMGCDKESDLGYYVAGQLWRAIKEARAQRGEHVPDFDADCKHGRWYVDAEGKLRCRGPGA